ncbi:MAG TPA: exodeoxyribonuclease III [Kofleriaceae bacterium]|nr:exodeoxyribonuclease III [Kofleriaceae bacterium]
MRIVAWNIENLARWLDDGAALAAQVEALGAPDVLCLQEVRLRPRDGLAVAAARALLPGYRCALALCDDPRNVTFRGGRAYGVATYVHERCGELATATPAWDREGRVLVTALAAHRLAIVNLYAVNGTAKPYVDPATGEPRGDRHAHKRRFQDAVFALGAELRAGAQVVLIGDWNVSRAAIDVTPRLRTEEPHATARAQLDDHLARGGWRDVFRDHHPGARGYTWFGKTRGGRLDAARVDYALVDAALAPRVTRAVILDEPRLRPRSDHAPIAIELAAARRGGDPPIASAG